MEMAGSRISPTVKALPRDNVQDGIAPLNTKTTQDTPPAPGGGLLDPPPAPTTIAPQPVATEPVTLDHPKVIDTAKLQSGETTVRLGRFNPRKWLTSTGLANK